MESLANEQLFSVNPIREFYFSEFNFAILASTKFCLYNNSACFTYTSYRTSSARFTLVALEICAAGFASITVTARLQREGTSGNSRTMKLSRMRLMLANENNSSSNMVTLCDISNLASNKVWAKFSAG